MLSSQPAIRACLCWASGVVLTVALSACAGTPVGSSGAAPATEAEWRGLRTPRPDPLPGAARVTITSVEMLGAYPWAYEGTVGADLGIAELAVAGLLRRRDVHFVERRRFAAAALAERNGLPRPAGRPVVGVSVGAEFSAMAVYAPLTDELASVEVRVTAMETGIVPGASRVTVPAGADPVVVGRALVSGVLQILDDLGRLPEWDDPIANVARDDRVAPDVIARFLYGLSLEEVWRWEDARRAYESAAQSDFPEASAALARTARLRLGGTLAES